MLLVMQIFSLVIDKNILNHIETNIFKLMPQGLLEFIFQKCSEIWISFVLGIFPIRRILYGRPFITWYIKKFSWAVFSYPFFIFADSFIISYFWFRIIWQVILIDIFPHKSIISLSQSSIEIDRNMWFGMLIQFNRLCDLVYRHIKFLIRIQVWLWDEIIIEISI